MMRTKKQFNVIIEQDQDGFFVASVPALPGCHTQAKTIPELRKRVREAISLCLDVARTDAHYRTHMKRFAYQPQFVGICLPIYFQ